MRVSDLSQPVMSGQRIEIIDILRGVAIFGMLLVNMLVFSGAAWSDEFGGPLDRAATYVIEIVAEGKFVRLFSFLFGLGFALQLQRAASRRHRFSSLYARRIAGLFVIGLAHGVLVAWVDTLTAYAILACALALFAAAQPRVILGAAVICLFIPIVFQVVETRLTETRLQDPVQAAAMRETEVERGVAWRLERTVYHEGTYRELLAVRWSFWKRIFADPGWYAALAGSEFVMFLLGLYAGRLRVFEHLSDYRAIGRRAFPWLAVGGSVITLAAYVMTIGGYASDSWTPLVDLSTAIGAMALSATYALLVIRLSVNPVWHARLRPLALAGRMALTNYLLQSVICATVFYEHGFGFYGRIGPAAGFALTVAIFAAQVVLSMLWLSRARFGPVEWLWRSVTYGRLQVLARS